MTTIGAALPLNAPKPDDRERLAKAATQFEAIFVRQMLAAARKTDFGNDLFQSQGGDTFRQMMDDRFADVLAESGTLGFARTIETRLASQMNLPESGKTTGE
jgi:flagellar protein FlgJ